MFDANFFQGDGRRVRRQASEGHACLVDEWAREYPAIFAYLAQIEVGEEKRTPGKMSMFTGDGEATVMLTDPDAGEVCFFTSVGFTEALGGLDAALREGTADWRKDRFAGSNRPKKSYGHKPR